MKRSMTSVGLLVGLFALLPGHVAEATPITRAEFSPSAVNFGFGSATTPTLTDGFLSVLDATLDTTLASNNFVPSSAIESPGSDGIRLDFASPISAVGMDFFANNTPMTLQVFSNTNALLDSVTISNVGLPIGSPFPFPYGFIGLNENVDDVAYAIINGGFGPSVVDVRIDNVVYQTAAVPEPATLMLTAFGLAGLVRRARRRRTSR